MMEIEQQFNLIAREYDENRKKFIPCFEAYYQETTAFIAANLSAPRCILDLGAGTGLLSAFWYPFFPQAEYILVDVAAQMLEMAKKRFAGRDNVHYEILDYAQALPEVQADVIISALSIHHLENADKEQLFRRLYAQLPAGGVLVNYDQFCASSAALSQWYDAYWEKQLEQSGLTERDLKRWRQRRELDRECSVDDELALLRDGGFRQVECVYANQKFAVIVAVK